MNFARIGRSLQVFYASMILFTMAALVAGAWWFWSQGPSHGSRVAEVYETNMVLERLSESKTLNEIQELVASDRVRPAVKRLGQLETEMNQVTRVVSNEQNEEVKKQFVNLRNQMHQLIEYPELSQIFLVLANKMAAFENYVVQNEWRTLTRLSRRTNARLEPAKLRSPGFFDYNKLVQTVSGIREDIAQMRAVTSGSVLSSTDKNSILAKIATMDSEIEMLAKYVETYKSFSPAFISFEKSWKNWLTQTSPNLTKMRLEQERASQWLLYGIVAIISMLTFGLMTGMVIYRKNQQSLGRAFEKQNLELIRDRLLPTDGREDATWSRDFSLEFSKYREYVHKRMSFGTIFQEATPFGAFLLDSNLGVVWTNDLFWKCWNLEHQSESEGDMTWVYLQRFTNLC